MRLPYPFFFFLRAHRLTRPNPPFERTAISRMKRRATTALTPTSASQTPASVKKSHRSPAESDIEYKVTIDNPHSFKSLCEIISNILINTHFQITKSSTFTGISIDSVDPSMVCMVKARFACYVDFQSSSESGSGSGSDDHVDERDAFHGVQRFCVRMKTLNTLLKHITSQHVLNIIKYADSSNILLRARDKDDSSSNIEFILKTLDEPCKEVGLSHIDTQYTVEIDLGTFKSICKMCKDIKAAAVGLRISTITDAPSDSDEVDREVFFTIFSEGDEAMVNYTFNSPVDGKSLLNDKSSLFIRTQKNPLAVRLKEHNIKDIYKEQFPTEYLNLFMKSMEKQAVHMTLAPGHPLILHYNLGSDQSHIRFILAANPKRRT